jgi:hypothetical protein
VKLRPHQFLSALSLTLGLALGGSSLVAQDFLTGPPPVKSSSGQFIIHAQPQVERPSWVMSNLATNRNYVRLDPALLAVSCERIKQEVCKQLGVSGSWNGRIYIEVRPTQFAEQNVTITSQAFKDGWQFQLDLPDPVERGRYVRAVTQALLLELANRGSSGRLAEVPLWLTEGLAQEILDSRAMEIILSPPKGTINGLSVTLQHTEEERGRSLTEMRAKLAGRQPLTFEELSWPARDAATTGPKDLFSVSAQMFVAELLRQIDGRANLRAMVVDLPKYYNWQFAFLRAFRAHFGRPLDVEKWWAVTVAAAGGRETAKLLPADETWRKLDETLVTSFEVRVGTNAPVRESWPLQGIIQEWALDRQAQALSSTLLELEALRGQAAQDVVLLVQDYCQVIAAYLRNEHKSNPIARIGKPGLSRVAEETLARLDALDARRAAGRPRPAPLADTQSLSTPRPAP